MANLKLNNVIAISEAAGACTLQNTIIKVKASDPIRASDGTASITISDSTGAVALSSTLTTTGSILPSADDAVDLGSATKQWRNIYTGDLHLKNERGSWTVIEEENYLTLRNNKTDKVYKLVMEEIE